MPKKAWAVIQKVVAKAKATTNATLLPKVAQRRHDGGWRFIDDPPVLTRVDDETRGKVIASLVEYAEQLPPSYRFMLRRYGVADVAHRVVGVGSVGTRAYLALLFGNGDDDPLFLQIKEATMPAHAPYLPPMTLRTRARRLSRRRSATRPPVARAIRCSATPRSTAGRTTCGR